MVHYYYYYYYYHHHHHLLLLLLLHIFMQDTYNYIPETNRVSTAYNVPTVLWLEFMVNVMLQLFCGCSLW